ncbi:MAG: PRC-barrel domain-containing protein [Candidatus Binataceae bacterium]
MRKSFLVAATLAAAMASQSSLPAFAQGKPQTLTHVRVDAVATGFRASKIVGATVINDLNERIGKIDDLIIGRDDRVPYAIVSVGGFLGMGDKLVAIPFQDFQLYPDKTVLPGADRDALKGMSAFAYTR